MFDNWLFAHSLTRNFNWPSTRATLRIIKRLLPLPPTTAGHWRAMICLNKSPINHVPSLLSSAVSNGLGNTFVHGKKPFSRLWAREWSSRPITWWITWADADVQQIPRQSWYQLRCWLSLAKPPPIPFFGWLWSQIFDQFFSFWSLQCRHNWCGQWALVTIAIIGSHDFFEAQSSFLCPETSWWTTESAHHSCWSPRWIMFVHYSPGA